MNNGSMTIIQPALRRRTSVFTASDDSRSGFAKNAIGKHRIRSVTGLVARHIDGDAVFTSIGDEPGHDLEARWFDRIRRDHKVRLRRIPAAPMASPNKPNTPGAGIVPALIATPASVSQA